MIKKNYPHLIIFILLSKQSQEQKAPSHYFFQNNIKKNLKLRIFKVLKTGPYYMFGLCIPFILYFCISYYANYSFWPINKSHYIYLLIQAVVACAFNPCLKKKKKEKSKQASFGLER